MVIVLNFFQAYPTKVVLAVWAYYLVIYHTGIPHDIFEAILAHNRFLKNRVSFKSLKFFFLNDYWPFNHHVQLGVSVIVVFFVLLTGGLILIAKAQWIYVVYIV
jgi:hypothetical protein